MNTYVLGPCLLAFPVLSCPATIALDSFLSLLILYFKSIKIQYAVFCSFPPTHIAFPGHCILENSHFLQETHLHVLKHVLSLPISSVVSTCSIKSLYAAFTSFSCTSPPSTLPHTVLLFFLLSFLLLFARSPPPLLSLIFLSLFSNTAFDSVPGSDLGVLFRHLCYLPFLLPPLNI